MGKILWTFLSNWQDRLLAPKCLVSRFLEPGCKSTCFHFSAISERCLLSYSEAEHSHSIIQILGVYKRTLCCNWFLNLSETACPNTSLGPQNTLPHILWFNHVVVGCIFINFEITCRIRGPQQYNDSITEGKINPELNFFTWLIIVARTDFIFCLFLYRCSHFNFHNAFKCSQLFSCDKCIFVPTPQIFPSCLAECIYIYNHLESKKRGEGGKKT